MEESVTETDTVNILVEQREGWGERGSKNPAFHCDELDLASLLAPSLLSIPPNILDVP